MAIQRLSSQRQKEIVLAVENLSLMTNLNYPDDSLVDYCIKLRLEVSFTDFKWADRDDIQGIITTANKKDFIFINASLSKERRAFTLAHEIGHYILHFPDNENDSQPKFRVDKFDYTLGTKEAMEETEANFFAASLLMPEGRFIEVLSKTNQLEKVAQYFGVSKSAVENRIKWINQNRI